MITRAARLGIAALAALGRARMARDGIAGRAARLHDACREIAEIHGLQLDVRGALPRGACVLVANHVSYLDAIAIAAMLPCAPIAKAEVAAWPVIGTAASELGVLFVTRDSVASRARVLRRALAVLAAGVPVLNFPEGTTSDGSEVLPFHRGIFGAARIAGAPIVPVVVRCTRELTWTGDAPFVPHYVRTARMAAPSLVLDIGMPIAPELPAHELALLAHHRIEEKLHAPVLRLRVPASRSNAVLSPAGRVAR